jgi:hypothetical protein
MLFGADTVNFVPSAYAAAANATTKVLVAEPDVAVMV